MAGYNNYFPQTYSTSYLNQNVPQNYSPVQTQAPAQPNSTGINWVQGEAGARSVPVQAGQKVILMDSESNVFYVKSSDSYGMPLPLRIFEYKELGNLTPTAKEKDIYITREEFEKAIASLRQNNGLVEKEEERNEQLII